jgi:hypothetical protein
MSRVIELRTIRVAYRIAGEYGLSPLHYAEPAAVGPEL